MSDNTKSSAATSTASLEFRDGQLVPFETYTAVTPSTPIPPGGGYEVISYNGHPMQREED